MSNSNNNPDPATTTPPSTLAKAAAEEIGKYLDAFTPLSPGPEMVQIFEKVIIERCLAGGNSSK